MFVSAYKISKMTYKKPEFCGIWSAYVYFFTLNKGNCLSPRWEGQGFFVLFLFFFW